MTKRPGLPRQGPGKDAPEPAGIRMIWLERVLPKLGVCSRTEARIRIRRGQVRVGGKVVTDPHAEVDPDRAAITVAGRRVHRSTPRYLLLHKPCGYVTTARDERGRKTVFDLLGAGLPYLFAVGRLDRETSGLLLLTNDSRFAERIADPKHHVPKTYRVQTESILSDHQLRLLGDGMELEDGPTRPAAVRRVGEAEGRTLFTITLTEGRNRQVRRMVEAAGGAVLLLERIAVGPLRLGDLRPGAWRDLTDREVEALLRAAGHQG